VRGAEWFGEREGGGREREGGSEGVRGKEREGWE
jgi:hypothetical protein